MNFLFLGTVARLVGGGLLIYSGVWLHSRVALTIVLGLNLLAVEALAYLCTCLWRRR